MTRATIAVRDARRPTGRAVVGAALLGAVALALAPGCDEETIVLATVVTNDGGTPAASPRCETSAECPAGFCATKVCGDRAGTCDILPTHCDDDAATVCGCDGITYFNDCLRRAAGVPGSTPGRCAFAPVVPCGGHANVACPEGARCAQLLGLGARDCPRDADGTCWVVPFNCPAPGPRDDPWVACGPPGAPCEDICTAIKSGIPHRLADACP